MNDTREYIELVELWGNYNQVRQSGNKKVANKLLVEFIAYLKSQDKSTIDKFVDDICALSLNSSADILANNGTEVSDNEIRIQHPLFKEIIVPRLIEHYKNKNAIGIKWIAQFEQFFYSDFDTAKLFLESIGIFDYFQAIHFFELSFKIEENQHTLTLLLNRMDQDIGYYTHEMPSGLLVSIEVFDEELEKFKGYWQYSDFKDIWTNKVEEWEKIRSHLETIK